MGEGGVEGFHLSVHQLPDHRLLLFSQTLGSWRLRPDALSLLTPDQGPPLLHGRIRHDHCTDSQEQAQVSLRSWAALLNTPHTPPHPPPRKGSAGDKKLALLQTQRTEGSSGETLE